MSLVIESNKVKAGDV